MGRLVRLDAPYVNSFKREDLTTDEDIRIEAENIRITDRFIETVKNHVRIYKDIIANADDP